MCQALYHSHALQAASLSRDTPEALAKHHALTCPGKVSMLPGSVQIEPGALHIALV
jgi:hypothetical protein